MDAAKRLDQFECESGVSLKPRDRIKQRLVLQELEEHFKTVAITSHAIKRLVRIKTDRIYMNSVQHSYICSGCDLRIFDRNSAAISFVCMQSEIDRLVELFELDDQHRDLSTIEKYELKDAQLRVRRSTSLAQLLPQSQFFGIFEAVKLLGSDDFNVNQPCTAENNGRGACDQGVSHTSSSSLSSLSSLAPTTQLNTLSSGKFTCMPRSISLASHGAESPATNAHIELRDAIHSVFLAHRSQLKVAIRELALIAMVAPEFQTAKTSIEAISRLDTGQLAFCLLHAISKKSGAPIEVNVGIAGRLKLDLREVANTVGIIESVLPGLEEELESSWDGNSSSRGGCERVSGIRAPTLFD